MNLRHFYDCLDWSKVNDAQLAKELGVSRQSINAARRQRGHAALSHGGKRPGAGRKAKALSEPANDKVSDAPDSAAPNRK